MFHKVVPLMHGVTVASFRIGQLYFFVLNLCQSEGTIKVSNFSCQMSFT